MKANRALAMAHIIEREGSELNLDPGEPGGASRYGVSVTAYGDWRRKHRLPPATIDDIRELTLDEALAFYDEMFASFIRFDDLPSGVDYRLLDVEVNLGPTGGVKLFEELMGVEHPHGFMTDALVAQAHERDAHSLILAIGQAWLDKKRKSPNWERFKRGWTKRMHIANDYALQMAGY